MGAVAFARLLRFVEKHYQVNIVLEPMLASPSDVRYLYDWISKWRSFFDISASIAELSISFDRPLQNLDDKNVRDKYRSSEAVFRETVSQLRTIAKHFDS
jgi:hypothetical protein